MTSTLLFQQTGIKAVQLHDEFIKVFYVDGNEPLIIHDDDELYPVHIRKFKEHVDNALIEEAKLTKPDLGLAPEGDEEGPENTPG